MTHEASTRHQLRLALDRLADELRRSGPQILPAHLRVLVSRSRAMYEDVGRELPLLAELLEWLGSWADAEGRRAWPEAGPSPAVAAERLKGFARQVGNRAAAGSAACAAFTPHRYSPGAHPPTAQ